MNYQKLSSPPYTDPPHGVQIDDDEDDSGFIAAPPPQKAETSQFQDVSYSNTNSSKIGPSQPAGGETAATMVFKC